MVNGGGFRSHSLSVRRFESCPPHLFQPTGESHVHKVDKGGVQMRSRVYTFIAAERSNFGEGLDNQGRVKWQTSCCCRSYIAGRIAILLGLISVWIYFADIG